MCSECRESERFFDSERHAVQWTERAPFGQRLVGGRGARQRWSPQGADDGVQRWIDSVDALERELDELAG